MWKTGRTLREWISCNGESCHYGILTLLWKYFFYTCWLIKYMLALDSKYKCDYRIIFIIKCYMLEPLFSKELIFYHQNRKYLKKIVCISKLFFIEIDTHVYHFKKLRNNFFKLIFYLNGRNLLTEEWIENLIVFSKCDHNFFFLYICKNLYLMGGQF